MNDDIELPPLPDGYEPHELPADYTGELWIEGQVRQAQRAAVLADRPRRASAEPYAWHYWNIGGGSAWHRGPSKHLDADIQAAKEFPRAHHVAPLYLAPPSTPPADALALLLDRLDAFRRERDALVEASRLALDALLGAAFDLIDDTEAQKCDRAINALRAALEGK